MAFSVPPKPANERRRRNAPLANTTKLPASGRRGLTPPWPLSASTKEERQLWKELWHTPQATMWEKLNWTRAVARYVRIVLRAEDPRATTSLISEARQHEDLLGLTPMSLLKLRWEVEDEPRAAQARTIDSAPRLRAIDASQ